MASRQPAYLQREALIRAGFEAAEKIPHARITAKMLASRAKLPARSIAQQFGDMDRYVATLQNLHYEQARNHTLSSIIGQPVGTQRILSAALCYLDFAFSRRGLRAWMSAVRAHSPDMQAQWKLDNRLYAQFVASEFALCGWPHPLAGARLFIAAVLELVRHEQQQARKMPAARRSIERYLKTYHRRPGYI